MHYVVAVLASLGFGIALRVLGIVGVAAKAIAIGRDSANCLADPKLSDLEKEKFIQRSAVALMRGFVSIVGRGAAAFMLAGLVVFAFQAAGLVQASAVSQFLVTWQGILLTTAVMSAAYLIKVRQ